MTAERFLGGPRNDNCDLREHLQKLPGDLLGVWADFAGGADAGGAAVATATVADQLQGGGQQVVVLLKQPLAKAHPRRHRFVNDNRWGLSQRAAAFGDHFDVAGIAHQVQRGQVA